MKEMQYFFFIYSLIISALFIIIWFIITCRDSWLLLFFGIILSASCSWDRLQVNHVHKEKIHYSLTHRLLILVFFATDLLLLLWLSVDPSFLSPSFTHYFLLLFSSLDPSLCLIKVISFRSAPFRRISLFLRNDFSSLFLK